MAKDMNRECTRCGKTRICTYADKLPGYCCGECWTEDLTIHPERTGTRPVLDEISSWQENVIRLMEDGPAC